MKLNKAKNVPIFFIILMFLINSGFFHKFGAIRRKINGITLILCFFLISEILINVLEIYGHLR